MSMPMSKDISHIVKFDGSNFQQWKFGCRLLLESLNLLDIVDGVEKMPAAVSYNPFGLRVNSFPLSRAFSNRIPIKS
jgi:hypothetical protein